MKRDRRIEQKSYRGDDRRAQLDKQCPQGGTHEGVTAGDGHTYCNKCNKPLADPPAPR